MASILDTLRVIFGADWTGGSAVAQMDADLKRVSANATQIGRAFSDMNRVVRIDSISPVASKAAVQLQALQARANHLRTAMSSLGSKVESGSISVDAAANKYAIYSKKLREVEGTLDSYAAANKKMEASQRGVLAQLAPMAAGIAAVGAAFIVAKRGIDTVVRGLENIAELAEEGAQIGQLRESFERLATDILKVPTLLEDMRAAARGTISDVSLMSSFLTIAAGTSGEFGRQLAQATPELVEIAKAANVLNPALGNTQFFFESLAKGIKRSEFRLVDNLGLNVRVREANEALAASLGKTVRELTAEEKQLAFLNETMRVGKLLIAQVGGATESLVDPYQQLEATIENVSNNFKEAFSRSLVDNVADLAESSIDAEEALSKIAVAFATIAGSSIGEEISKVASALTAIELLGGGGDLENFVDGSTTALDRLKSALVGSVAPVAGSVGFLTELFGPLVGAMIEAAIEAKEFSLAQEGITRGFDEFADKLAQVNAQVDTGTDGLSEWTEEAKKSAIEAGNLGSEFAGANLDELSASSLGTNFSAVTNALSALFAEIEAEKLEAETDKMEDAIDSFISRVESIPNTFVDTGESADIQFGIARDAIGLTADELLRMGFTAEEISSIMNQQGEAFSSVWEGIREKVVAARQEFVALIGSIQENPADALVSPSGSSSFVIAGPSREQQATLNEYRELYGDAAEKARKLSLGIGTVGKSQEAVNKALSKANEDMAHYQNLINGMDVPVTQFGTKTMEMALNLDTAQSAFFDMVVGAGAAKDVIGDYGVAIGKFTPEQFGAAVATEKLGAEMQRLAELVASGQITAQSAERIFIAFFDSIKNNAANTPPIGVDVEPREIGEIDPSVWEPPVPFTIPVAPEPVVRDQAFQDTFDAALGGKAIDIPIRPVISELPDSTPGGSSFLEGDISATADITTKTTVDEQFEKVNAWFEGTRDEQATFTVETVDLGFEEYADQVTTFLDDEHIYTITANPDPAVAEIEAALARFDNYRITVYADITGIPELDDNGPSPGTDTGYHRGGIIGGGASRGVRILAHQGEYVLNRSAVNRLGTDALNNLNGGANIGGGANVSLSYNFYGGTGGGVPSFSDRMSQGNAAQDDLLNTLRQIGFGA